MIGRHVLTVLFTYCLTNDNILPSWERSRSCAAQGYIRLAIPLRRIACQVPAVRKAPRQEGIVILSLDTLAHLADAMYLKNSYIVILFVFSNVFVFLWRRYSVAGEGYRA